MTTLRIEPQQLRAAAGSVNAQLSGPGQEALAQLRALQTALRGAWSAQAQTALDGAFGNWLAGFDRRAQDLVKAAAYLRAVSERYEALERQLTVGQPADLVGQGAANGAGKVLRSPVRQGTGPSISGPTSVMGGSFAAKTFDGTAQGSGEFALTNVRLTYRADYALEYYSDRVVVRLTQYPSTAQVNTPTHWSSAATIITRSGKEIQYVIDPLDPQIRARPEEAVLNLPIDPNDPPVRMDLYVINVADGPAGAFPSRQYYDSVNINVPAPTPTQRPVWPNAPTQTPGPIPTVSGPGRVDIPRPTPQPITPTPQPGTNTPTPGPTPTRPVTPPRHGGPAIPE